MEMDIKEFRFHLERWEEDTGKKDKDFCKEIGIHPNTLVNWKKGKAAPQADKMRKICETLRINEVDLQPMSFYTAHDNENKLYYRTQQLQRYAKRNGLDDDFYKQITGKPYFVKEFPFSSARDRFFQLRCPEYLAEDEEYRAALRSIPLSKFEFQDMYGTIIMLTEKDIDFLIKLQRKGEQLIRDEFYLETRRIEEQNIKDLVQRIASWHLEDGNEMDPDKLYEELTQADFSERIINGSSIWERFREYCETHNVTDRSAKETKLEDVERRHPPMTDAEEEAWREHYQAAGMTEDEVEAEIQWKEKIRQHMIEFEREPYKQNEEGEEGNNGQH